MECDIHIYAGLVGPPETQLSATWHRVALTRGANTELPKKLRSYRVVFHWYPPKKLKYGKPIFGESMLT